MISANVGHVWHLKFDMWNLTMSRKNKHKHQSTWVAGTLRRWTEGNGQTSAKLQCNNNNKSGQCRILTILSDIQPSIEHDWSFVLGAGAPHDISKEKVTTQITKARKRQKKTEKDRKRQKKTEKDKKRQKEISKKPYWYKTLLNQPLFYCYRIYLCIFILYCICYLLGAPLALKLVPSKWVPYPRLPLPTIATSMRHGHRRRTSLHDNHLGLFENVWE